MESTGSTPKIFSAIWLSFRHGKYKGGIFKFPPWAKLVAKIRSQWKLSNVVQLKDSVKLDFTTPSDTKYSHVYDWVEGLSRCRLKFSFLLVSTNATYVPCLPVSTSLHWVCTQNCFLFNPEFVSVLRAYLYTCSCLEKCHSFGPSSPIYGNENRSFPLNVPAILIKKSQAFSSEP